MAAADRVTIDIPNFATMSDDDVAAHPLTRVLDGRWSPLTPAAIKPVRHRGSAGGTNIPLQRTGLLRIWIIRGFQLRPWVTSPS